MSRTKPLADFDVVTGPPAPAADGLGPAARCRTARRRRCRRSPSRAGAGPRATSANPAKDTAAAAP